MKRGWWDLKITGVFELTECDQEHIGKMIADGFTSGEIVQEED